MNMSTYWLGPSVQCIVLCYVHNSCTTTSYSQPLSYLQVNKNWLLKARVGSDAVAAALALKAWWQPSMTFAVAAVYDFASRMPRLGLTFNVENYGNIRCARSLHQDNS